MNTAYCPTCSRIRPYGVLEGVKLNLAEAQAYAEENADVVAVEFDCGHMTRIVTKVGQRS